MSYLQNWRSYQPQILHQECFYGYNESCKVSLQSVDVNLDFWNSGLIGLRKVGKIWSSKEFHPFASGLIPRSSVQNLILLYFLRRRRRSRSRSRDRNRRRSRSPRRDDSRRRRDSDRRDSRSPHGSPLPEVDAANGVQDHEASPKEEQE